MMAGDGEGATALFEVKVVGAKTKEQAKFFAKSVVCSNLTKAAIADMMPTGEEFYVQWDIRVQSSIRKR